MRGFQGPTSQSHPPRRGQGPSVRFGLVLTFVLLLGTAGLGQDGTARAAEWAPGPEFPTSGAARSHVAAVELGGTIWALGGTPFDMAGDGSTHSLTAGASTWTTEPSQEGPILWHGAGIDALGRIVVFAGHDATGDQEGSDYVYNPLEGPEDGLSHRSDDAPLGRFAWATDDVGRIYSVGGGPGPDASAGDPNVGQSERYLAASDTWELLPALPYGVAEAALSFDGQGHMILFGGIDATASARLTTVAQLDLNTNSWSTTAVPPMPIALSGHKAVLGSDERIYVIGGESGPVGSAVPESRVWVLHLPTGTWSEGPSMTDARAHFGAVLGPEDTIYALGGDDTGTVETLYTPPCPTFSTLPTETARWAGETLVLDPQVSGGTPITYRWQKDGVDLFDGLADGGGVISGAETSTLVITQVTAPDAGTYVLVATNACGTKETDPTVVAVESPADIHSGWTAGSLHPAGALSSRAHGTGDGQQAGMAMVQGVDEVEEHAMLWTGSAESAVDLHNPETIKTSAVATSDGVQGGNWHEPFEIFHNGQWYLVYYPEACAWSSTAGSFQNLRVFGWEYSSVGDSDGGRQVGTVSRDDEVGNYYHRAGIWSGTSGSWVSLHPTEGVSNSYGNAIDGDHQFGSILTPYPGPIRKAAMWSGTAASYEDLHPAGASRSWVSGAGGGQQVGTAEFSGELHPILWSGHRLSAVDLTTTGGLVASLEDADGGLQVGSLNFGSGNHAVVWASAADDHVDLHTFLGPNYITSSATGIDVDEDGTVWISGWARNGTLDRDEAVLWQSEAVSSVDSGASSGDGTGEDSVDGSEGDAGGIGGLRNGDPLEIHLGPNPANASSSLELTYAPAGEIDVRVFDASGRVRGGLTWRASHDGPQRVGLAPALAELPTGAYFVRVRTEGGAIGRGTLRIVR